MNIVFLDTCTTLNGKYYVFATATERIQPPQRYAWHYGGAQ